MLDYSSFFITLLRLLQIHRRISELVLSSLIDRINPHLVQINKEDHIITEASDSMQHGHLDHKREHIVNKRIERLIDHGIDRNVSHTLQLVVDKQLGRHRNESCALRFPFSPTEQIHKVRQRGDNPIVPRLVRLVDQRVHRVPRHQRIQNHHQMLHRDVVVLLRLARAVRRAVANSKNRHVPLPIEANLHRLGDLPQLQLSLLAQRLPRSEGPRRWRSGSSWRSRC